MMEQSASPTEQRVLPRLPDDGARRLRCAAPSGYTEMQSSASLRTLLEHPWIACVDSFHVFECNGPAATVRQRQIPNRSICKSPLNSTTILVLLGDDCKSNMIIDVVARCVSVEFRVGT
jgi:hypothetical protein